MPLSDKDDDDARRKGKQPLIEDNDEEDHGVVAAYITTTIPPSDASCSTRGIQGLEVGTSGSSRAPLNFQEGYHFAPRDDELIRYYLDAKLSGRELPLNVFNDVQLYDHNPEELVETYKEWGEDRWYFFTPRKRKYPGGSRPNRTTKDGYWKATGSDQKIQYKGSIIGSRKSLVYYQGKSKGGEKTDWVMYEYTKPNANNYPPKSKNKTQLNDWVLCSIQMTRGALSKQNKRRKLHQVHGESSDPAPQSLYDDLMIDFTEGLNLHQVHGGSSNPALQNSYEDIMDDFTEFTSVSNYPEDQVNQFHDERTVNQLLKGNYELESLDNHHSSCGILVVAQDAGINNGYGFHEVSPNEQLQQSFTPDQLMLHSSTPIATHPFMVNGDGSYGQFSHRQQMSSMEYPVNNGDELYRAVAPYVPMPHSITEAGTTNRNELYRVAPDYDMSNSVMHSANYTFMCNGDGIVGAAPNQQMTDLCIPPNSHPFMGSGHELHRVVTHERMSCMESGINAGPGFSGLAPSEQMPQPCFPPTNFPFMNNGDDEFNGLTAYDQQMSSMEAGINNGTKLYDAAPLQNMAYSSTTLVNCPPMDDGRLEGDHPEQYPFEHGSN